MTEPSDAEVARIGVACLDLTNLDDGCAERDIDALCARAVTAVGPVAAVCVWPRFVAQAKRRLAGAPVKVATVVNFPIGGEHRARVVEETLGALRDGADEIDLVLPYRAFAEGRADAAAKMVDEVREACKALTLKVILETGMLREPALIRRAADLAIAEGADFVKTSTGKVEVGATADAAMAMLASIASTKRRVGLKPSGGVRTLADARTYIALAQAAMGDGWVRPETFRLGASSLLDVLLASLGGTAAPTAEGAY
jgi:deoxyribose-phosphate aldolase